MMIFIDTPIPVPPWLQHPAGPDPTPPIDRLYDNVRLNAELYRTYAALEDGALQAKLSDATHKTIAGLVAGIVDQTGATTGLVGPDMDEPNVVFGPKARALAVAYRLGQLSATFAEGDRVRSLLAAGAGRVFAALY